MLLVLFPLYFVLIASFSDPNYIYSGEVWLFPKGFTLDGYERIFSDSSIWIGYVNSILYATLGTIIGVAVTVFAAYPLARKNLVGKSVIMWFLMITMFFSGGLIPTYLLIKDLHMLNTIWALVIPGAGGVFNVIIVRTFFNLPYLTKCGKRLLLTGVPTPDSSGASSCHCPNPSWLSWCCIMSSASGMVSSTL